MTFFEIITNFLYIYIERERERERERIETINNVRPTNNR